MRLFYCDCDSLVFSAPLSTKEIDLPLEIGESFGQFKHEFGPNSLITEFECHGRKNLRLCVKKNGATVTKTIFKIRGISTTPFLASECIKKNYSSGKAIKVPQARHVHEKKMSTQVQRQDVLLESKIDCQRIVNFSSKMTYPWGFFKL